MPEASTIFQSTLLPPFSHSRRALSSPICHAFFRRNPTTIRCSSVSTEATKIQTVPWGCDTDSLENASALQKWLSDSGMPPQKMVIQRVDIGERGLVALKNIRKGEKLLFVPPSLVITADSVILSLNSS
nr:ribulose-1,5 bisphosphate carboxylase/oxygenase large subunit N-methyltransferase, chloroplastic-like [Ipomoea batatas]